MQQTHAVPNQSMVTTESKVIRDDIQSHNGDSSTNARTRSTSQSVFASVSTLPLEIPTKKHHQTLICTTLAYKTNDSNGIPANQESLHVDTGPSTAAATASIPEQRDPSESDVRLHTPCQVPPMTNISSHSDMTQSIRSSHVKTFKKRKRIHDKNPSDSSSKNPNVGTMTSTDATHKVASNYKKSGTTGRWTAQEHQLFVRGLTLYGREWKRVALDIPTRTSAQVRSHAQKYLTKMEKQLSLVDDTTFQPQSFNSNADDVDDSPPAPSDNGNDHSDSFANMGAFTSVNDQSPSRLMSTSCDSVDDGSPSQYDTENDYQLMSDSVRQQAARILANPTTVEQEVRDTLTQLRRRYQQLQDRIQRQQPQNQQGHVRQQQTLTIGNSRSGDHEQQQRNTELHQPVIDHQDHLSNINHHYDSTRFSSPTTSFGPDAPVVYVQQHHDDDELIALHVLQGLQKQQLRI